MGVENIAIFSLDEGMTSTQTKQRRAVIWKMR